MKQLNWYQIFGQTHTIPDGSTVTPTDDVQILLNCANIWDKAYTTIADLLSDTTSLLAVIVDNNAINYLVRSTTFASSMTADATAMTDIGGNNYASNTLLGDSTWCTAICNSTYFESVLNVKVPTMTSNTTPEGRCIATTENSSIFAYYVFDNTDSTGWRIPDDYISVLGNDMTGVYAGYVWNDDKPVIKMVIAEVFNDNYPLWVPHDCTWQLQGQKDDDSWEDIGSAFTMNSSYDPQRFALINFLGYKAHRISCKTSTGNYTYTYTNKYSVHMAEVQFYGRADV